MSLLDEIRSLASTVSPSHAPSHGELPQVVGAIVKVLEHAGVTVAEELYPVATADVVAAAGPVAAEAATAIASLEKRFEALLTHLEKTTAPPAPVVPPAPEPAPPAPVTTSAPPAPVVEPVAPPAPVQQPAPVFPPQPVVEPLA